MSITHSKISGRPDGVDRTKMQPSDWNDNHVILGAFDPMDYGAVFDGVTDDSAAIQACFDAAYAVGTRAKVLFPYCQTAKINSGLTLRSGRVSVDFGGCLLDASAMTSGYALSILPNPATPYNVYQTAMPIDNFILLGSESESSNADGIYIGTLVVGAGGGVVANLGVYNFSIKGFRDGMLLGDRCWLVGFYNFIILDQWRTGITFDVQTEAGENVNFHGGVIGNVRNVGGTGTALLTNSSVNADTDVFMFGVSLDYSDVLFDHNAGALHFYGCHMEDNGTGPMGYIRYDSLSGTTFLMSGGRIHEANSTGRAKVIEVTDGDHAHITLDSVCLLSFTTKTTRPELVSVTAGSPHVSITNCAIDNTQTNGVFPLCKYSSRIYNGSFDSSPDFKGWTVGAAANMTLSIDATQQKQGPNSLKVVNTAAVTSTIVSQQLDLRRGGRILAEGWYNVPGAMSGFIAIRVHTYADNGDLLSSTVCGFLSGTTSGAWARMAGWAVPLPSAARVTFEIWSNGFSGTAYLDWFHCWEA